MVKLKFILADGREKDVDTPGGRSVMQAAVENGVEGVVGDCGGNLACATCHGYIDAAWRERLAPPTPEELLMLEGALDVTDDSRLTCQIPVSEAVDGLVVRVPENSF